MIKIKKSVFENNKNVSNPYKRIQKTETELWGMNKQQLQKQKRLAKNNEQKSIVQDVLEEKYRDKKLKNKLR